MPRPLGQSSRMTHTPCMSPGLQFSFLVCTLPAAGHGALEELHPAHARLAEPCTGTELLPPTGRGTMCSSVRVPLESFRLAEPVFCTPALCLPAAPTFYNTQSSVPSTPAPLCLAKFHEAQLSVTSSREPSLSSTTQARRPSVSL